MEAVAPVIAEAVVETDAVKETSQVKNNPTYAIIPAKSDRAKCKEKDCGKSTVKGQHTILKSFEGSDSHIMSHYYCLDCFFTKVMVKARAWNISVDESGSHLKCSGSCDELEGFETLDKNLKEMVLDLINTGNASIASNKQPKVNFLLNHS